MTYVLPNTPMTYLQPISHALSGATKWVRVVNRWLGFANAEAVGTEQVRSRRLLLSRIVRIASAHLFFGASYCETRVRKSLCRGL